MKFDKEVKLRGPFTWRTTGGEMRLSFQLVKGEEDQRFVLNIVKGAWEPYGSQTTFGDEVQFELDPTVFHGAIHAFEAGKESIEGMAYTCNEDGSISFEK